MGHIDGITRHGTFTYVSDCSHEEGDIQVKLDDTYLMRCKKVSSLSDMPSSQSEEESLGQLPSQQAIDRYLKPQSPFVFLNDKANRDTFQSLLEVWNLSDHIVLPVILKDGDSPWTVLVLTRIMTMAKEYGCKVVIALFGYYNNWCHDFITGRIPVIRFFSNVVDNDNDIGGNIEVYKIWYECRHRRDRHSHYILSSLGDRSIISKLVHRFNSIVCQCGPPDYLTILLKKHQHIQILHLHNVEQYLRGSVNGFFLELTSHFQPDIRQLIGQEIAKECPGLNEIGIILPENATVGCDIIKRYCVHDEGHLVIPTLIEHDLPDNDRVIVFNLTHTSDSRCVQDLLEATIYNEDFAQFSFLIVDPNAILFTKSYKHQTDKNKDSRDSGRSDKAICLTSVSGLNKQQIDVKTVGHGECHLSTLTVPYRNDYVGTYVISTGEIPENQLIVSKAKEVLTVNFVEGNSGALELELQTRKTAMGKLETKEETCTNKFPPTSCLKDLILGSIKPDYCLFSNAPKLVQCLHEWKTLAQPLKSSLLFRVVRSLVDNPPITTEGYSEEFSEWALAAPRVIVELIAKKTDLDNLIQLLVDYLQLKTPEKANKILEHPSIQCDLFYQAQLFLDKRKQNAKFLHDISERSREEIYANIGLILCHLGRTTELSTILKSCTDMCIVSCLLYSVGILKYEVEAPVGHGKVLKSPNDHARLRECVEKYETLAQNIIDQLYRKDRSLPKYLCESILASVGKKVINLAFMVEAKPFFSTAAWKEILNTDWWGELRRVPWWKVPFYVLFPCFSNELHSTNQENDDYRRVNSQEVGTNNSQGNSDQQQTKKDYYNIPGVKSFFHSIAFATLLVVFSISVLTGLHKQIQTLEYIILVWMVILFVEEIRQMLSCFAYFSGLRIKRKLLQYFTDFWNVLDLILFLLYGIAFILRVVAFLVDSDLTLTVAHALFAVVVVALFVRSLQFVCMHKIGPILIMIRHMSEDLFYFMLVLFIIVLGYGVAIHSVLYPSSSLSWTLLNDVIQQPYLQIYGEIDVDPILTAPDNPDTADPDSAPGFRNYFGMILAGTYLLFTNILLLNLLIAMFNSSYVNVKQESIYHHLRHMHTVLTEYRNKSFLPPPLVIFDYIYRIIKKCCNRRQDGGETSRVEQSMDSVTRKAIQDVIKTAVDEHDKVDDTAPKWYQTSMVEDNKEIKYGLTDIKQKINLLSGTVSEIIKHLSDTYGVIRDGANKSEHTASEVANIVSGKQTLKEQISTAIKTDIQTLKDQISTDITTEIKLIKDDISTVKEKINLPYEVANITSDIQTLKDQISTDIKVDIQTLKDQIKHINHQQNEILNRIKQISSLKQ